MDRHTYKQTYREDRWTDIYTNRHIERTDGQTYIEDRWTDT